MNKRRHFLGGLLSIGVSSVFAHNYKGAGEISPAPLSKKNIKAKKLIPGNVIGLIAPGFSVSSEQLTKLITFLEASGFKVFQTGRIKQQGYFSNTDQERANDVNEMFLNNAVDAILCVRGGYGCTRILDLIDYDLIKKNPKIILGFSDVTALIQAIHIKTGLIGFHGPVGTTIENPYAQACIENILMTPTKTSQILPVSLVDSSFLERSEYERYTIQSGLAKGRLIGGSLTLMCALVGTPYELDFTDCIVCIEDVEEKPYRMDRMLTQLLQTKTFKKAAGIAFGVCAGCDSEKSPYNFTLKEVIMNRISGIGIPAAYGLSFGHVPDNCTLPIGALAVFNADSLELEVLETVVV